MLHVMGGLGGEERFLPGREAEHTCTENDHIEFPTTPQERVSKRICVLGLKLSSEVEGVGKMPGGGRGPNIGPAKIGRNRET